MNGTTHKPSIIILKNLIENFYRIDDLSVRQRYPELVTARQALVYMCKKYNIMHDTELAKIVGRHRTSVINMRQKISDRISRVNGRVPDPMFLRDLDVIDAMIGEMINEHEEVQK